MEILKEVLSDLPSDLAEGAKSELFEQWNSRAVQADARQHGRQFVGGRTRAVLGRHFPLRHQAFGREPLFGELRFDEVRQRTVETHLPFLLLGAMTGDAMFLEERPNHQGKRASVRVVVRGTGL